MKKRRVYGPVPSRRFGLSLGVDLVPHKVCCLDCVYCQLGGTTRLVVDRQDFYPPEEILTDVHEALETGPRPEVVTLAGSGEPTLYRSLGTIIAGLREASAAPVLLLTNGTLLFRADVARDAGLADVLAPSLDAGDEATFLGVNRPHPDIGFDEMVAGLRAACERHPGTVRLEVMLVRGMNDSEQSIRAIADLVRTVRADSIDINTPVRPSPGRRAGPCAPETLERARELFGDRARIVAAYRGPELHRPGAPGARRAILDLLSRRPCTLEDLHASLGRQRNEILKELGAMLAEGMIEERDRRGVPYYFASFS